MSTTLRTVSGFFLAALLLSAQACHSGTGANADSATEGAYPYDAHDALFSDYVTPSGFVRYAALARDARFPKLVETIGATDPSGLPAEARLAFWINTYNVLVLEGVLRYYPVESVTKARVLHGFFKRETFRAAGRDLTLDDIEHGMLRKEFQEPRIHFALVCGAASCPPLRREAYRPERMDEQLRNQAQTFFSDRDKNRVDREHKTIYLSSILDWFGQDFVSKGESIERTVAVWFPEKDAAWIRAHPEAQVRFLPYDWSLNDAGDDPRSR